MKRDNQIPIALYAFVDFVMASITWVLFFYVREWLLRHSGKVEPVVTINERIFPAFFLIALGWLMLYTLVGSYHSLYKKSRLLELATTFTCSLIGSFVLFFIFILDD